MGSFITGTELKEIQDGDWEEWEKVTIREYNQGQKDAMDKELIELAGPAGEVPKLVMQSALVPVMVAGIHSWTFTVNGEKDGPVAPVNRTWLAKLRPSYAGFIVAEIRKLNQGRPTAEERDFLRRLGFGDTEEGEAAAGADAD